jgi:hypothetical protein
MIVVSAALVSQAFAQNGQRIEEASFRAEDWPPTGRTS